MKKLILLLLLSSNAQANCLDDLESLLASVTHPSSLLYLNPITAATASYIATETREAALVHLHFYKRWVFDYQKSLHQGSSNSVIRYQISSELKAHEQDTVFGVAVGEKVVSCVRPYLTFRGTKEEQARIAKIALQRIIRMEQAVR